MWTRLKLSRRTWILISASLMLLVLLGAILALSSPREPSYQGKSLGTWIVPFCRQTTNGLDTPAGPAHFDELQPTRRAVSAMGTNAVPFLIARLNHSESRIHATLRQLATKKLFSALKIADPRVEKIRAIRALTILGPAAHSAVPSLANQMDDPEVAQNTVYALAAAGPTGLRVLVDQLTNRNAGIRMQIASAFLTRGQASPFVPIAANRAKDVPDDVLIDAFTRMIQDPRLAMFRLPAIQELGFLGPVASNSVPVLLPLLADMNSEIRQRTIRALGNIKAQPEIVIPALTNSLNDSDIGSQTAAFFALHSYGYEAELNPIVPRPAMPGAILTPGSMNSFAPGQRIPRPPSPFNGPL